jgi:predicted DNA-binding helix-hairpin-helix protein
MEQLMKIVLEFYKPNYARGLLFASQAAVSLSVLWLAMHL